MDSFKVEDDICVAYLLNVFVTDKESACINAIRVVFPKPRRVFCTFYISKCVQQLCKPKFTSDFVWEKFIQAWINLTRVTSKAKFYEG